MNDAIRNVQGMGQDINTALHYVGQSAAREVLQVLTNFTGHVSQQQALECAVVTCLLAVEEASQLILAPLGSTGASGGPGAQCSATGQTCPSTIGKMLAEGRLGPQGTGALGTGAGEPVPPRAWLSVLAMPKNAERIRGLEMEPMASFLAQWSRGRGKVCEVQPLGSTLSTRSLLTDQTCPMSACRLIVELVELHLCYVSPAMHSTSTFYLWAG